MKNSRNKQFIRFKLRVIPSRVMTSRESHWFSPWTGTIPLSSVITLDTLPRYWSRLVAVPVIRLSVTVSVLVCKPPFLYLIMAAQLQSSDAGNGICHRDTAKCLLQFCQKVRRTLMLQPNLRPRSSTSVHLITSASHSITRRLSTIHNEILWERDNIHIAVYLITGYCYNCSILLFVSYCA